eukprot:Partr_v1_DN27409_c3_g1_i1_m71690 putative Ribosomal protein
MSAKKAANASIQLVRLYVPAGQATPTPPIGPALGQRGVKAIDFCKQYNDRTKDIITGVPMRCVITVRPDRTFTFDVKPPTTTYFVKKAAGVQKCASEPGREVAGTVSLKHIYEIAKVKQADPALASLSLKTICSQIKGSCRNMGISVVP